LNERIQFFGHSSLEESLKYLMVRPKDVQPLIEKYSALRLLSYCQGSDIDEKDSDLSHKFKKSMNLKHINIVDPCFSKNNLGKSISLFNSHRLKEAFGMQDDFFYQIHSKAQKKFNSGKDTHSLLVKEYCKMFKYTLECTGKLPPVNLKLPQMTLIIQKREVDTEDNSCKKGIDQERVNNDHKSKSRAELKTKLFTDKNQKEDPLFDLEGEISDDQ
jgi:hypothetical protein